MQHNIHITQNTNPISISLHAQYNQQPTCRICLDIQPQHNLISPCICKGSTKYVHEGCLMQWATKNQKYVYNQLTQITQLPCQICKHHIPLQKTQIKYLRNCSQIKTALYQQKYKFLIEIIGILCLITCLIYLGFKYQEYLYENNQLFSYLTIVVIVLLNLAIIGLICALVHEIMMEIVEKYGVNKEYMEGRNYVGTGIQLRNQIQMQ